MNILFGNSFLQREAYSSVAFYPIPIDCETGVPESGELFVLTFLSHKLQVGAISILETMASLRENRVIHTHTSTTTPLNSAGARGQHRCNTQLGGRTMPNTKESQQKHRTLCHHVRHT